MDNDQPRPAIRFGVEVPRSDYAAGHKADYPHQPLLPPRLIATIPRPLLIGQTRSEVKLQRDTLQLV